MNSPVEINRQRFASALSTHSDTASAIAEVTRAAVEQLEGEPQWGLVFCTHHHTSHSPQLSRQICDQVGTDQLIGCTGESVVGVGSEIENEPAIALWLADLPGVTAHLMHLRFEQTTEGGTFVGWPDALPGEWPAGAAMVLLGDPFSFPADVLLERMNEDRPGVPIVGGMASGGSSPGDHALILGKRSIDHGAVAIVLHGDLAIRTVVSQGCRPIGHHLVITRAEQNVIHQLGGKPALDQLRAIFSELPTSDQMLVQNGLHVGRVVSEYQNRFEQGDFLIRNVIGFDQENAAIAVAEYMRAGQTIQFHVRDRQTADDDLRQLLAQANKDSNASPAAALLFTCNGRGTRLFDQPHHDAQCLQRSLGDIPLAGFFAQGELGPVGNHNFMHGFTASIALFENP